MPVNFTVNENKQEVPLFIAADPLNSLYVPPPTDEEGDYSTPNPKYGGYDVRWTHWQLDKNMNLKRTAADFYLLLDLNIEEEDAGRFEALMLYLIPQFTRYTDMAVGGEIRHSKGKVAAATIPAPLRKALTTGVLPSNRHQAWHNWKFFRGQFGSVALKWSQETFNKFGGGGFGGPRWANIAKILWMFETGQLTPITFIDSCWGLEHNGGAYFNKAWQTQGMKAVLDANLAENFDYVRLCASPSVRQMHIDIKGDS